MKKINRKIFSKLLNLTRFLSLTLSLSLFATFAGNAKAQWIPAKHIMTGLPYSPIYLIIYNVMRWGLGIFSFIAVISFVISGVMYLVSAGDEKRQEGAKRAMYYSIMGVIVGLSGLIVIWAAVRMLGVQTNQF
jgi:hypothetical protein